MLVLASWVISIVVLVCEHIEEIVQQYKYAAHVTDIEVTCQGERKENNEYLVFSVFHHLLYTVGDQGEPHYRIDPHSVVLVDHAVSGHSVKDSEGYNCKLIFLL